MRNPSSPDGAEDWDAPVTADAITPAGIKRLLADAESLKLTVDYVTARERIAKRSMGMMTAYLAGELSAPVAAELEDMLRTEPVMREIYASLFAAWQAPNAEREVTSEEVDASYARFKAKAAARSRGPDAGKSER